MEQYTRSTKKVPLVSVVMASFNSRQYIGDAIRSITDQFFSDFEFIIVDDGSLDGSAEIAVSLLVAMAESK